MGNDLEIEIRAGSTPGTWEVEVDSPAGTASGTMSSTRPASWADDASSPRACSPPR